MTAPKWRQKNGRHLVVDLARDSGDTEQFSGNRRSRNFAADFCGDSCDALDELRVTFGYFAFAVKNIVLKTHANMPTHDEGLDRERKLKTADSRDAPVKLRGRKQRNEVNEIFRIAGHAAGNSQDELKMHGLAEDSLLGKTKSVFEHPGLVNFELRHHAVTLHLRGETQNVSRVIHENIVAEIHRTQIERGHLGLQ